MEAIFELNGLGKGGRGGNWGELKVALVEWVENVQACRVNSKKLGRTLGVKERCLTHLD